MTMPSMTGDQLSREIMTIRPDMPVILCTGYSEKLTEEKVQAMGVRGFLLKPVVLKELAAIVRKALDETPPQPSF
jgi:CheY-like chemotaxis protein